MMYGTSTRRRERGEEASKYARASASSRRVSGLSESLTSKSSRSSRSKRTSSSIHGKRRSQRMSETVSGEGQETPVLRRLVRFRKELDGTGSTSSSNTTTCERCMEGTDFSNFQLDPTPIEPFPRRRSIKRGYEWSEPPRVRHLKNFHAQTSRNRNKPRISSRRVSLRGFTKEEGIVTREQAKSFSSRYSLQRSKHKKAEDVIGRNSISIDTLLRFAAKGKVEKVVALIEGTSIGVDACSKLDGATVLHIAAAKGHTAMVVALYGLQANLESVDAKGNTPLIAAATFGQLEVVLTLLSCGADSQHRNHAGETALIAAAKRIATVNKPRHLQKYMQIVRAFFERAPSGPDPWIPEYTESDIEFIKDASTRILLQEWTNARAHHKDLHLPNKAVIRGRPQSLKRFFEVSHSRLDVSGWIKVALLLTFIVYDVYQPHFSNSNATFAAYVFLYLAAYYC